ncbi:putative transcription factor C2H2 family [Helianthus annuus]|nr:putative transcription factor C2H2 family [Helianthus annuus]
MLHVGMYIWSKSGAVTKLYFCLVSLHPDFHHFHPTSANPSLFAHSSSNSNDLRYDQSYQILLPQLHKSHHQEFLISAYRKMMRLQTYAGLSVFATLAVIYHAFSSRGQFYPATVYLSTSKVCLVLLLNMGLVIMCIMWQLTKKVFLGSLREAEVERLNEQSWREVMEILFAITIFRQDFSVMFLAMVTALLLIKSLHWLAQKRVEYIETTPTVPMLSHVRIVSFMGFLLLVDCLFLYNSVKYLIQTRQASVSLFFSFEYMILATTTMSTFVKYVFYVSDMLMEGQWERKAVYTFYLELIRDLLHLSMYLCFFLVIFVNYGVPLHLIRELYETFRNFKLRIADYIRYRKITSNMNDRFPDATPEELNDDATCIICREEMTTAKRLVCGHLFHVHCLRSWLERQHTCPTCRALVIPNEGGTSSSRSRAGAHRQGANSANTSSQDRTGDSAGNGNISQHQKRVQAAAAAASIYQKSFVYPSPISLTWSSGYALLPNKSTPGTNTNSGEHGISIPNNPANFPSSQYPQTGFTLVHASPKPEDGRGTNVQMPVKLEAEKKMNQDQIKVFQEKSSVAESSGGGSSSSSSNGSWEADLPMTNSNSKGKAVSSSFSVSGVDQSQHGIDDNRVDVNNSPL